MMSPAVILTNALLLIMHTSEILSVPTLSVLTSVLVLIGTRVMDISPMTSTNALQTLTTVMSVLEFVKTMMVLSHVRVKPEQLLTALDLLGE